MKATKRILPLLLALCLLVSLFPVTALAAGVVEYERDGNGKRVGIKSIVIDGVSYYDIYNGSATGRTDATSNIPFLKDVLTKADQSNTATYSNASPLNYWSQLAMLVFSDNSYYTSIINASGGFDQNFGRRGGQVGYADLVYDLQRASGSRNGSRGSDNTWYSGLSYAESLKDVRNTMADSVAQGVNPGKLDADRILRETEGDNTLKALNVDTKGDVLYSIVTGVDEVGFTAWYYYNSYGIAFYDFQLSIIADNNLEYITAAEGEDSILAAVNHQTPGVTYEEIGNSQGVTSYYTNDNATDSTVGMEFSQTNSTELSNSMTTTETYTFREMIGSETKFNASVPLLGGIEQTIKLEFTAEQAFSTAYTDTKTVKQEHTNTVSASLVLPAHTVIAMETADGTVNVTLEYDCPVAVTYKVAVFSLCGYFYSHNLWGSNFTTAGYWQGHFSAVFGEKTGDARTDLYNRVFLYANTGNYEQSLGATYGWIERQGDGKNPWTTHGLNWGSILGNVTEERLDVGYSVVCYEVERVSGTEGEPMYVPKSDTPIRGPTAYTDGVANYENLVRAPSLTAESYSLVTDIVWRKDAGGDYTPVDNSFFEEATGTKLVRFTADPDDNVVPFYYIKDSTPAPAHAPAPAPPAGDPGIEPMSTGKKAVSNWVTTLDTEDLANWLGKHQAMSATGGKLKYSSRSMSTSIHNIEALYPLRTVKVDAGSKYYEMIEGDALDVSSLVLGGYNESNAPYYGFDSEYGHWILVGDNDQPLGNSGVATLTTNAMTGRTTLTAGDEDGTVYLKYIINDNRYSSYTTRGVYATNNTIATARVEIKVSQKPFAGWVEAYGSIVGYEGESMNLNVAPIRWHVIGADNTEINAPVTWKQKYIKGLSFNGNELIFEEAGDYYEIWPEYRGVRPEGAIPVTVLPRKELSEIEISDTRTTPKLLADHILGDGYDSFDLSLLAISGKDQYGNDWPLNAADLTWYYKLDENGAATPVGGEILTVTQAGTYTIWAGSGGVKSNELTLLVKPARAVESITISGDIPALSVNPNVQNHSFDLNGLKVDALDQYGDSITHAGAVWKIVTGGSHASIAGSVITGWITGSGTVRLVCNGVESNELPFTVKAVPYVKELFQASVADYVVEGLPYNLTDIVLTAKDQWGGDYTLSAAQIASIVWDKSTDPKGSVNDADVTLDAVNSTLTVATGAVGYARTEAVILTATLPDRGDGQPSTALYVTLNVRQAPVPAALTIGLKGDAWMWSGNNRLVFEFFAVSAKDQYGVDFPITTDDVGWASDNVTAFKFETLNGQLAIAALDENGLANITASVDVVKQNYKDTEDVTILSNAIELGVPGVRRVGSIKVTGAPVAVAFGSSLNIGALTPTVYDNASPAVAFTKEALAAYPAMVSWLLEGGGTDTKLDPSTGQITFGNTRGIVTLNAIVVNSITGKPVAASAEIKISVGPTVTALTPNPASLYRNGGNSVVTLTGQYMSNGITVTAFDANGDPTAIMGKTAGNAASQTVTLNFPANPSTTDDVVYTLKVNIDGAYEAAPTATVTVGTGTAPTPNPVVTSGNNQIPLARPVSFDAFIFGYADGTFRAPGLISREQFVAILYRLNADPAEADYNTPSFSDVASGRWSFNAVEWALAEGIIDLGDGKFNPALPLTRADMAVMFVRCEGLTEMANNQFTDIGAHRDRDDILRAVKAGIFNGFSDNTFRPDANTSREQAVAALIRYLLGGEPTEEMVKDLEMPFTDIPKTHWGYRHIQLATHGYEGVV